ncbi:MAG: C4-dicarboxylate transporter DcuC [Actinomycetaceae bacterium]|nr:C4-dicarboxylate transporter DcuC [Actinomycetaceae bacterium]
MLYVIIALLAIVAVGYFIVKRVHAAAAIFFVGVILLMVSAMLGTSDNRATEIDPTGNAFYDQLLVISGLFSERFAGIGMSIMVLFGFVAYMRHIGADGKAVVLLSAPLRHFHGSYWMVPVGFLIGNLLSLVVPSASALSLLLIATLLPALVAAGLTPLTVGAIVVTSSTIMPTPLEAGLIQGASLTNMPISEYVFGNVAKATVPTLIAVAFIHMWWQHYCDKRDALKEQKAHPGEKLENVADKTVQDALERAAKLPNFYALLPLMPLIIIVLTATLKRLGMIPFETGILPATVVSLFITAFIEIVRLRSINDAIESMKNFWKGMGEGAAGVVALLVAAAVLVEGITQLGVIKMLTDSTAGMHGASTIIIIIFVLSTVALATLTGSGVAPYFAFSEVVPALSAESGVLPIRMLNSIWGTSNLMRQVSPVAAAVLIVSGAIKVNPIELVKRTSVPMISGTVLNVLFSFLFIHA